MSEVVVGKRFVIQKKIGCGSFGEIYSAIDRRTGEKLAAKAERSDAKHPQLKFENKVYTTIPRDVGFPEVFWFGESGKCNVMVMELLGPSLETLFASCRRKFSLKTVAMLGLQVIDRLRHVHEHNYVHRDVKPDNFLIGKQNSTDGTDKIVYVIDLGLCKRYRDGKTHTHIPYRDKKRLTGTPRYASIFTHQGIEQSRRDDLESLGYILVYFCRGVLPWMGMKANTKQEKYDSIGKKKMSTPVATLCEGLPSQFESYLTYCRGLKFVEKPDYTYLKRLFTDVLHDLGTTNNSAFDWDTPKSRSPTSVTTSSSSKSANHRTTAKRYVPCAITKPPMSRRRGTAALNAASASGVPSRSKPDPHQTPTPVINTLQPRHRNANSQQPPPPRALPSQPLVPPAIERTKRTEPRVPPNSSNVSKNQYHSPTTRSAVRKSTTPANKYIAVGDKKNSGGRRSRAISSPATQAKDKPLPEIIDLSSNKNNAPLREKNTNAHHHRHHHSQSTQALHLKQKSKHASIPFGVPPNARPSSTLHNGVNGTAACVGRPATAPSVRSPLRSRGAQAHAQAHVQPTSTTKMTPAEQKPKDISDYLQQRDRRMKRKGRQRNMTANAPRPPSRVVPTAPVALKSKAVTSTHSSVSSTPSKGGRPATRSLLSPSRLKDLVAPSSSPSVAPPAPHQSSVRELSPAPRLTKKGKHQSRRPTNNAEHRASHHHVLSGNSSGGAVGHAHSHTNIPNVPRTLSNTPTLARTATNTTVTSNIAKNLPPASHQALSLGRPSSGKSGLTTMTSGVMSKSSSTRPAMSLSSSIPTPSHAHNARAAGVSHVPYIPSNQKPGQPVPMEISRSHDVSVSTRSITPTLGAQQPTSRGMSTTAAARQKLHSGASCASGSSVIGVKRSRTAWTQTEDHQAVADDVGGFDATQQGTQAEREKMMGAYEAMELERDRWKRQYESVSQKYDATQHENMNLREELEHYKKMFGTGTNHHQQQHQQQQSAAKRRPSSAATAPPVVHHHHHLRSRSRTSSYSGTSTARSNALPPTGATTAAHHPPPSSSSSARSHLLSPTLRNQHQPLTSSNVPTAASRTTLPLAKRPRVMASDSMSGSAPPVSSSTRRSSRGSISSVKENLGLSSNRPVAVVMASSPSKMPPRKMSSASRAMAPASPHHHHHHLRRKSDVIIL